MRIAVVHDWLVTDAGAEKVLRALLDIYPQADIYSLVDFLSERDRRNVLGGRYAKTSFIQRLPFAKKHFRNYFFLFPTAIESFDLSAYDLIISSSWAVAKGVKKHKNQLHVSYCYTPIRYAWDLYDEYTKELKFFKRMFVKATLSYIRRWDIKTLKRVDRFIADSKFVQERIKRIYGRESVVIYPPVDTKRFTCKSDKEDFYLSASRLVPYKKTRLIVEAFNEMSDKRLVVIGSGEEYDAIKKIAKENVEVLGFCENDVLRDRMQRARAFVYAAVEDFGIVPIEAMSCGTPVIALNQGGTAETVIDAKNGVHFDKQTKDDIKAAVQRFEGLNFDPLEISKDAAYYDTQRFKEEIRGFIAKLNVHTSLKK